MRHSTQSLDDMLIVLTAPLRLFSLLASPYEQFPYNDVKGLVISADGIHILQGLV